MISHIPKALFAASALFCVSCSKLTVPVSQSSSAELANRPVTSQLTVATWNMEHFTTENAQGCRLRSPQEFAALISYAKRVNADVYAIQEAASEEALRAIFPVSAWNIYFSGRADSDSYECRENGRQSTQQKVAVVTRKSLTVAGVEQFAALGLTEHGLRYGVEVDVATDAGPLSILAVHLKSGCFVQDYRQKDSRACNILSRQVPQLQRWIKQHEQEGRPYLILGDFNHRLAEPGNYFASQIKASVSPESQLTLATAGSVGCHPKYPAPIDHIWAGGFDTPGIQQHITVWAYQDMAVDAMLSDHCAVSVALPVSGE